MNMKVQTPTVQTREPSTTKSTPAMPPNGGGGPRKSVAASGSPEGGGPPGGRPPGKRSAAGGPEKPPRGGDPTAALMKTMQQTNDAQMKMQVMQQEMVMAGSQRSIQMEANRQMTETAKQASKDMGDGNKKPQ
jgi:hypothetical protein